MFRVLCRIFGVFLVQGFRVFELKRLYMLLGKGNMDAGSYTDSASERLPAYLDVKLAAERTGKVQSWQIPGFALTSSGVLFADLGCCSLCRLTGWLPLNSGNPSLNPKALSLKAKNPEIPKLGSPKAFKMFSKRFPNLTPQSPRP